MIALSFSQKQPFNKSSLPEDWRSLVSVTKVYSEGILTPTRYDVTINVSPEDSSYRYRALKQKPQLVLKFSLPFFIEFPVGTKCVFQNQRFILTNPENLKKQGSRNIEYTMTLGTNEDYMAMWKFRNTVDRRLKFSMCAKPHEFIEEIVNNLNKRDTSITWEVGTCIESAEKTVEFNHVYIDAALTDVANVFETEYEIEYIGLTKAKIHLRKVEYFKDSPVALSYGKGNGFIPGVGRSSEAGGQPVKRMYVQGSNRNIDRSKYGAPELLLPKSQTLEYEGRTYKSDADGYYIERSDKVSTAIKDDSLDCSEIYPSRVGRVSSLITVKPEKNYYDFTDTSIPPTLNFNDYLIAGESMTIIFQDGMLVGKEFDVKYKHDERRFEIVPQEYDGVTMPNETFKPKSGENGDTYAIFGIMLPSDYICNNAEKTGASWDMFRAAAKALYECEDQKFTFSGQLQALWTKRNWLAVGGHLVLGGYVLFTDNQFAPDGVKIRITGIKDYVNSPYSPTIELSNSVSGASMSSTLREINNTEVVIEDTKKEVVQYTKRRFRDAIQTIEMLGDSLLDNFTHSVSPIAVQTMALLVGDESLQFRFAYRVVSTDSEGNETISYSPTTCIGYNQATKKLYATMQSAGMDIYLQHLTLGQNAIMTQERREENGYLSWPMTTYNSPVLNVPEKSYYLYARVHRTDHTQSGTFVLSETAIDMHSESNYYHLLCGILNSEIDGERSFVTLYGFTEILPGRITTDLIISNDGRTYFDLEKGEIGGAIKFLSDSGYITIIEGGKIKTELIDVSELIARSVIVGEEGKQRVEIRPSVDGNGSVKIFDSNDKECAIFEGAEYKSITDLYDGNTGGNVEIRARTNASYGCNAGVTLGRGEAQYYVDAVSDVNTPSGTIAISKVWKTEAPTEVVLKRGYLQAYAYSAGYQQTSDYTKPQQMSAANAFIQIIVETFQDEALTNKISSLTIASVSANAYATTQMTQNPYDPEIPGSSHNNYVDPKSETKLLNLTTANKSLKVPAGWHRIVIYFSQSACRSGSYTQIAWGGIITGKDDIAAEYKNDAYVSRYFANGLCLGSRNDNFCMIWKDLSNNINFRWENSGFCFSLSNNGIQYRTSAKGEMKKLT